MCHVGDLRFSFHFVSFLFFLHPAPLPLFNNIEFEMNLLETPLHLLSFFFVFRDNSDPTFCAGLT